MKRMKVVSCVAAVILAGGIARAEDNGLPRNEESADTSRTVRNFNRWNQGATGATLKDLSLGDRPSEASFEHVSAPIEHKAQVFEFSVAHTANRAGRRRAVR